MGTTTFEDGGLVSTEIGQSTNKIRIANGAIYGTIDGGATYFKIFSAKDGIAPALIGNGKLNLENLVLGSADNPSLRLDKMGMTAFLSNGEGVDYSTFVRFDNYGMYGIKNYKRSSSTNDATDATLSDIFVPTDIDSIYENANFGLTWNGFFLNTGDGTGRVSIGTAQDLKMSIKDVNNAWQDRLIIGKLQDGAEPYYGFRIIDDNKNVVLNTDDKGRLYLRHKLYISHFNDEYGTITETKEVDGVEVSYTTDTRLDQTNVALGIVKAYRRNENNGYDQGVEMYDNYSSLDYLTKVFSVKSAVDGYDLKGNLINKKEYFKQFNEEQIATLIDPNENLAIFDNGNLYAKNAWVEGNIRATGGNILGTLSIGKEAGTTGVIKHANNAWSINGDGTAFFNNVNISGTISSAVFEYNKIQTVAGGMAIFPAFLVETSEENEEGTKIYLQNSDIPYELKDAKPNGPEGAIEGNYYICFSEEGFNNQWSLQTKYKIEDFGKEEEKGFYVFVKEKELAIQKEFQAFIFEAEPDAENNNNPKELLGIVINARDSDLYPQKSISIIDLLNPGKQPKLILGYLNQGLFENNEGESDKNIIINKIGNTYGLYCDNVYLKGSLVSETAGAFAGISTSDFIVNEGGEVGEKIIFFAGPSLSKEELKFYVTNSGKLYAKEGYFKGTIEASEIKGCGNDFGLTIRDAKNAIRFLNGENTIFDLTDQKTTFYGLNEIVFSLDLGDRPSIKLYGQEQQDFLLRIERTDEEIEFKYNNETLLAFGPKGAVLNGGRGAGIGLITYFEDAFSEGECIGSNIVII